MHTAEPAIQDQLNTRWGTAPSPTLTTLISHPGVWHHIALGEVAGTTLLDQRDTLQREGDDWGVIVCTDVIPGHRAGGFFAVVRRPAALPVQ